MITQREQVLKYMEDFGSITPLQAVADLGIYRLGARIYDLKKAGYKITSRTMKAKNRYGKTVRFAEYRLEEKEPDEFGNCSNNIEGG